MIGGPRSCNHASSFTPMKTSLAPLFALAAISTITGCASRSIDPDTARTPVAAAHTGRAGSSCEGVWAIATHDAYKRVLAQCISEVNAARVSPGRPQALLRSVVVLKYTVDAQGNLLHSSIMRSNKDVEAEAIALSTLRKSAPFPQPASHLLHRGHIDIIETWLFNNDGRFQLRTIAQPQMDS